MWQWDQSAGELRRGGQVVSRGYSGNGRGKNNPALQGTAMVGPIPRGMWKITQLQMVHPQLGPYVLHLEPNGHAALGRSAFRIHGDSVRDPGSASHGCIILPRNVREMIWKSGDRDLEVVE